ncbi:hypothetical protein AA14337_3403 [Acetobacter malorum DSM 14337]|uniref:Lipoprotein n=2 Tax=Acetobacter malorum TaxID=178901 RepID=A0ABQ0Q1C7_9PROT|nr:hypothetical protein AA14337_3403 [Acetobacter malorum DSM 14337]
MFLYKSNYTAKENAHYSFCSLMRRQVKGVIRMGACAVAISGLVSLSGCSGVVVNGKFVPTGSPEATYQYAGHSYDIVPALGRTDRIVLRGSKYSADTQLTNVSLVAQQQFINESVVVIKGNKYSGDYLPTWEVVSTRENGLSIHRIPSGGGNPPYTFSFNQDGLVIHTADGPGMFYRQNKFYSLQSYERAEERNHYSSAGAYSQNTRRHHQVTGEARAEGRPPAQAQGKFVDDVGRVSGGGLSGSDAISGHVDLQE